MGKSQQNTKVYQEDNGRPNVPISQYNTGTKVCRTNLPNLLCIETTFL